MVRPGRVGEQPAPEADHGGGGAGDKGPDQADPGDAAHEEGARGGCEEEAARPPEDDSRAGADAGDHQQRRPLGAREDKEAQAAPGEGAEEAPEGEAHPVERLQEEEQLPGQGAQECKVRGQPHEEGDLRPKEEGEEDWKDRRSQKGKEVINFVFEAFCKI